LGEGSPKPASTPRGAVFLSYASQDAEAAQRICEALRSAGVEVWFDQSELRGGDAWDQSIRKQIKSCALFVPVISQHTHERAEGYFRLEWKLAVDRCHLMAADKAFLVPVVIDDTPDDDERVPEKFRELQWTRLPEGNARPEFLTRIQQLLSGESGHSPTLTRLSEAVPRGRRSRLNPAWLAVAAILAVLAAYLLAEKPWGVKPAPPSKPATFAKAPTAFNPPPHSIAVLPFVNMSGEKEQEYFSDGLTEEILNSLVRIDELQVSARTSSFYFKGEHADLATIAHKLNVASVLEGSVRRSGNTIRITAQLNDAVTGFHLWSQTYDRKLTDVLAIQAEIANAVANALKVTLLGNVAAKIEAGGTRNPAAFDAYLRASKAYRGALDEKGLQAAIAGYTEAIRRDPDYAIAYADRSLALADFGRNWAAEPDTREYRNKAQADARKAIAASPDLADGHLALANLLEDSLEFASANQEYERALALAPGNAKLLRYYGAFAAEMGRFEAALAAGHRSVALDPLNPLNHFELGVSQLLARRFDEAIGAFTAVKTLAPDDASVNGWIGYASYANGNLESARAACEGPGQEFNKYHCLAMVYNKLGRHADAEVMLGKAQAMPGDPSLFLAMIYAQWGDIARALDLLETAMRHRDPYLEYVKTNPFLDPLRKEPRFQAVERALKFPN
jgi:TolB-like protein/lipoprotein NlpI